MYKDIDQHHQQSFRLMKEALKSNLYSISLKDKAVTNNSLSLIYTPGVGVVCKAIESNLQKVDVYTNRINSVAIVSNGGILQKEGKQIFPFMDWLIVQIKYYSDLDAYPFAVDKTINLEEAVSDLSNSFGTVLVLEKIEKIKVNTNVIVLSHQALSEYFGFGIQNAQKTARIIAYLINSKQFGFINSQECKNGQNFQTSNILTHETYHGKFKGHSISENSLAIHEFYRGKIHIELNFFDIHKLNSKFTLPNIKRICEEQNPYSKSKRICAIVTDGTAILGFGNIGPRAGLPVMEGKSALFKHLGNVQVVPVCINPKKAEEEIQQIRKLVGNFAAVNLEDISAPNCFRIEEGLKNFGFPVFHDDQHGTAIIVLAGLINASKVIDKSLRACKVVVNGAGAAGITIAKLLLKYGVQDVIVCDTKGSIFKGRTINMNKQKQQLANITNKNQIDGDLSKCLIDADIFVGVSAQGALKGEWIPKMNPKNIIFALANPIPQIMPDDAKSNGGYLIATGRSDFANQINNSLVFPGIFRGILDNEIKYITMDMKVAAAQAIAKSLVGVPSLTNIVPPSLDPDIAITISEQIKKVMNQQNL